MLFPFPFVYVYFHRQPPDVFCKKGVLKNFANFTWKYLCWCLFFNKTVCLRPAVLLKKRLRHRCFPVKFTKFLRTPILKNIWEQLVLHFTLSALIFYTLLYGHGKVMRPCLSLWLDYFYFSFTIVRVRKKALRIFLENLNLKFMLCKSSGDTHN